jgi:hypothetical protein
MKTDLRRLWRLTGLCLGASALAGCSSILAPAAPAPAPQVSPYASASMSADQFVGRWGLASYHRDADRARTEKEAHAQCNKPYVIGKGPHGGLMMHLADQAEAEELALKGADGGKNFIGPPTDPAGGPSDREVVLVSPNSFSVIWTDKDTEARYGTMVYARCAAT